MSGFIQGESRYQFTLFPEQVDGFVDEDSVVRVIDVFTDRLLLSEGRLSPSCDGGPLWAHWSCSELVDT